MERSGFILGLEKERKISDPPVRMTTLEKTQKIPLIEGNSFSTQRDIGLR